MSKSSKLRAETEAKIMTLGRKQPLAMKFLRYLYGSPISAASDIAETLGVNISTAIRLIDDFIKLGILIETTGYKRNRIFSFDSYMDLFR